MAYDYVFGGSTGNKTVDTMLDTASGVVYDAGAAIYNKAFGPSTSETALVTPAGITKAPANTTVMSNS